MAKIKYDQQNQNTINKYIIIYLFLFKLHIHLNRDNFSNKSRITT